ncbi:MAG: NUDIX hydrolase, partial [Actinomycetota bacterium]
GDSGVEVCLVHRPKYDDWTLPKGKVEPGEHVLACAVREVAEETGYRATLGRPLPSRRYRVAGEPKIVYYWLAHAPGDRGPWRPTREVDDAVFVPAAEALRRLSYAEDADLVALLPADPAPTRPLVILRHTEAVARRAWGRADAQRPLTAAGAGAARRLVAPLSAFEPVRIESSDAVRCTDTVRPYATHHDRTITVEPALSEDGHRAAPGRVAALVHKLIASGEPTLVCSHRPVLPDLLAAAAGDAVHTPAEPLPPGGFHVVHYGADGVTAVETHA